MRQKKANNNVPLPSTSLLEQELKRTTNKETFYKSIRNTVFVLMVVAAAAIFMSTFLVSVLRIQGSSMDPTLDEKQYVVSIKTQSYKRNEIIAFYYNNKVLLKRVIGLPGDMIYIDDEGNVSVNGNLLEENYISGKCLGEGDVTYPFQVPDNQLFVLGDHRDTSLDSRYSVIGTVLKDQIEGRVLFRVWPLSDFGAFGTS